MILVLLQNAWSKKPRTNWKREMWLRALAQSRTGRRLFKALSDLPEHEIYFENTTRAVGTSAGSKPRIDYDHVREVLQKHTWDFVIACGKQAEQAAREEWDGKMLVIPHPAYRVATNALFASAGLAINRFRQTGSFYQDMGRIALRQRRGSIEVEHLIIV